MIVLVEQHRTERPVRATLPPAPDAGGRWGTAARFDYDQPEADGEEERRGGVTLVWPPERTESVVVEDMTPVWRSFDVVRIRSSADPDTTEEATVTTAMLIPLGSTRERYVGGGTGYVEDPGNLPSEERVIHTFLLLHVPSPLPEAEVIDSGTEGAWPDYPVEMVPPGGIGQSSPLPGDWTR